MLSVSNAITTNGLSSKVQRYIVQVSASLWLHGDKSWTSVNNISHMLLQCYYQWVIQVEACYLLWHEFLRLSDEICLFSLKIFVISNVQFFLFACCSTHWFGLLDGKSLIVHIIIVNNYIVPSMGCVPYLVWSILKVISKDLPRFFEMQHF